MKYLSGITHPYIKRGHWMSQWIPSPIENGPTTCAFDHDLVMCFGTEAEANHVSKFLREHEKVETEVVKVGE